MIFLELGFIIFLLHVKIRERSLPYYQAFPFSIIAVDVLDSQSLDDHFQTPIFFSTIAIISLDIQWTKATIILNQQSIISTIVVNIFNHQSIIISITEINIFDHQSTNSAIAINFWITSCELIPLLTDMASHTGCDNWKHSWRFDIIVHVCQFIRSRADANVQYFRSPSKGSYGLLQPHFTMGTLVKVQCDKIHHSTANCFNLSTIE